MLNQNGHILRFRRLGVDRICAACSTNFAHMRANGPSQLSVVLMRDMI